VPTGGVAAVALVGGAGLLLAWLFGWGTQQIVFIPSTLVIVVYLLGTAAAVKLLHGGPRIIAAIGAGLTASALPFALAHILVPIIVGALALISGLTIRRHRTKGMHTASTSKPRPTSRIQVGHASADSVEDGRRP